MEFDVAVIGSGPGGYSCAEKLGELGKKVALVEKYSSLGGTCLNVGCIPTKALLDSTELFFKSSHSERHGFSFSDISFDLKQMMERKTGVIKAMSENIRFLMKKNKVTVFQGVASFVTNTSISINSDTLISAQYFVIATGSKPANLNGLKIDKKRVITSTEALSLNELPKNLVIIGAGAIGLELASIFARLGSTVKIIEYFDRPLPMMDIDLGRMAQRVLEKELGIEFFLSHKVTGSNVNTHVTVESVDKNGSKKEITGDICVVSIGRIPYTDGLNLEKIGVTKDEKGRIVVDQDFKSSISNIFAIGDVIKGPMLAHKAEKEGVTLAENICGIRKTINYNLIPSIVYTSPEVASVGKSESELEKGKYKSLKLPLRSNGRASASGDTEGLIKVLSDINSRQILGVHIFSPHASDIISEAALALKYNATLNDISDLVHGHPTYSEIFKDVCSLT